MAATVAASAMDAIGSTRKSTTQVKSRVMMKLSAIEEDLSTSNRAPLPWVKTPKGDTTFGMVIFLNAAFIGVDVELSPGGFYLPFWLVETGFLIIFLVEIGLRLRAEMPHPRRFFDAWGIFDFGVTVLGCVDAWAVTPIIGNSTDNPLSSLTVFRVFRLVRLVRLVRVFRMFSELVLLVQTLSNSLRAVGWMSLLLGMITYTGSIICVLMIGQAHKEDPLVQQHFGTLGDALFSHFCVVTLEGWPDIAAAAMNHSWLWAFYFVAMIALTNFALVNLMVGIIVEGILRLSSEQESELQSFVAESEQFKSTLMNLFKHADIDSSGTVTREEVRELLHDRRTHDIMNAFGINLNIPPQTLHTIMDLNRDGETTFEEFFSACMRLCGSKSSIHSIFVQHDICECQQEICRRIGELEERLVSSQLLEPPLVKAVSFAAMQAPTGTDSTVPHSERPLLSATSGAVATSRTAGYGERGSCTPGLAELLQRMDRFGHVQSQIFMELKDLKDEARKRGDSSPRSVPCLAPAGPTVRTRADGRELGPCCIDSLFSERRPGAIRPPPTVGKVRSEPASSLRDGESGVNLTARHRKELHAEFTVKRAPSGA